jgi:hypothetical protein
MDAIPLATRKAVLADCDGGMGTLAVSIKHGMSPAWVRRLKQRRRETGEITARPSRIAPTSPPAERRSGSSKVASTSDGSSFSTKRG